MARIPFFVRHASVNRTGASDAPEVFRRKLWEKKCETLSLEWTWLGGFLLDRRH